MGQYSILQSFTNTISNSQNSTITVKQLIVVFEVLLNKTQNIVIVGRIFNIQYIYTPVWRADQLAIYSINARIQKRATIL